MQSSCPSASAYFFQTVSFLFPESMHVWMSCSQGWSFCRHWAWTLGMGKITPFCIPRTIWKKPLFTSWGREQLLNASSVMRTLSMTLPRPRQHSQKPRSVCFTSSKLRLGGKRYPFCMVPRSNQATLSSSSPQENDCWESNSAMFSLFVKLCICPSINCRF